MRAGVVRGTLFPLLPGHDGTFLLLSCMDEPSEGLAPAIVDHLAEVLRSVVSEGQAVLPIEQNLRFATELCDRILVMVNRRIAATLPAGEGAEEQDVELGNSVLSRIERWATSNPKARGDSRLGDGRARDILLGKDAGPTEVRDRLGEHGERVDCQDAPIVRTLCAPLLDCLTPSQIV